jgi:hypothetical protein
MNLYANMVRDQADDAFAIGDGQQLAAVADAFAEPIDPQPAIRVEHDFDNRRVVEPGSDRRPERRAQHPCPARLRLGSDWLNGQGSAPRLDRANRRPASGAHQETQKYSHRNRYLRA